MLDDAEQVIAYARQMVYLPAAAKSATEPECVAARWETEEVRKYRAGRTFNLITDWVALTWLLKSTDLSPKLDQWALSLMEYDVRTI